MSEKPMEVLRAINAVQAALAKQGLAKAQRNQGQGFNFRGIDDVLNALSSLLASNGLVILPRVGDRQVVERQTNRGTPLFNVVVTVNYTLFSAADGSSVTVQTIGEAMDSADKATNKAMSAAYKYMAIQTFAIPTEGDNDADAHSHEVAAPPRDLSAEIRACTNMEELLELWRSMSNVEREIHTAMKNAKKEALEGEE